MFSGAGVAVTLLVICRLAFAKIRLPGDPKFCTQLRLVQTHDGDLSPTFDPGVYDYTLRIPDAGKKSAILALWLDDTKYRPLALPVVKVDGALFIYDPVESNNTFKVDLGDGCMPVDHSLHISVSDPHGAHSLFGAHSWHDYYIRIQQPPRIKCVTAPTNIAVFTPGGQVLNSTSVIDYKKIQQEYVFILHESNVVHFRVRCSEFATSLRVDGRVVQRFDDGSFEGDTPREGSDSFKLWMAWQSVVIECMYRDSFFPEELSELYTLTIHRYFNLSNLSFHFMMERQDGNCSRKAIQGRDGADQAGFECWAKTRDPSFIIMILKPLEYVPLQYVAMEDLSGGRYLLKSGVATVVRIRERISSFMLRVYGELAPIEFPVRIVPIVSCREVCGDSSDYDSCCAARGEVCSMAKGLCGFAHRLRSNAQEIKCNETPCGVLDALACCVPCKSYEPGCNVANSTFSTCPSCWDAWDPEACCAAEAALQKRARLAEERLEVERRRQVARLAHFEDVGCFPEARGTCGNRTCFYDETCQTHPARLDGLGCWAAGLDIRCRFCGFKDFVSCPTDASCFDGECHLWSEAKRSRCESSYNVTCFKLPPFPPPPSTTAAPSAAERAAAAAAAARAAYVREQARESDARAAARERARVAEMRLEGERRRQRARLAHFEKVGCFPDARAMCDNRTCFYDETCLLQPARRGGLGCFAAGVDVRCRFCGFGGFDDCPEDSTCFDGECQLWDAGKSTRCREAYGVTCFKVAPASGAKLWTAGGAAGGDGAGRGLFALVRLALGAVAAVGSAMLVVKVGMAAGARHLQARRAPLADAPETRRLLLIYEEEGRGVDM